jgi:hypothetical protein
MSNHKNSLVKVLEYLVNDEREKAADLLHNVFVEKAKNHWAAITESDEVVEDDIQDEDLDETIDVSDEEEDFLNDIETAEEEIDQEEIYDAEDMDGDNDTMDISMDMGDVDGEEAEEAPAPEEALANVEDAIAELRAAFADLMGDASDHDEPDADNIDDDNEEEPEMEGFVEAVALKSVTATMADGSDNSAKSPVGKGGKGATDAKPHPTDTKVEAGGKAPAAKAMSVKGPEAGAKLSAAPAPKREMK